MQKSSLAARLFLSAVVVLAAASALRAQQANSVSASFDAQEEEPVQINVMVGQSRVLNFDAAIGRFSVSDPNVAEAVLVAQDQVLVNGKAFGQVNFIAWDQKGARFVVFDVYVRTNLTLIDSQIRTLFPKEKIELSQANGSVVISGSVSSPKTGERVEAVVKAAGFNVVNMLETPVTGKAQIQLQVRVAEVSRSRLRELGASYAYQSAPGVGGVVGSGGGPWTMSRLDQGNIFGSMIGSALNLFVMGGNTYNFIHALKTQGALRSLAEPNLIAMDGQQASFLAGGEFPVPMVQANGDKPTVTVVFKEYGVRLNFKPTILDEDHIRLELEPEVSTIDFANGVKFDGFLIPALKTRRAKTGVELRDGQSFALAGLIDNQETRSLSKMPIVGDIPILGTLFNSKSFQKSETELMFIVTANMVRPVRPDDLPQMRGIDGLKTGSPLGVEPKGEGIQGDHGFSTGQGNGASSSAAPESAKPAARKSEKVKAAKAPRMPRSNTAATPQTVAYVPAAQATAAGPSVAPEQ
ncbi:MAG TPA: pilus assembly protein N-terminal domain-containing protein [Pyrinomonadaceae bacterium]|jgi:pilus assembly protein CpaC|nr:pilus assembly protein N-terminal domain-containing protein [Pyrinomonadaceae bacterium]